MPKLALNGINLGAIMAIGTEPKVSQRDIGDVGQAVDGTMRVTRSARKLDTTFRTIPLSTDDANAWRSYLTGEGEKWSFDASLYGSKGTPPSASTNVTQSAGSAAFGAGKLSVGATTGTITYPAAINSYGLTSFWTVGVWRFESGAFHHYVVTSAAHKWVDGVRDDAAVTTWLSVSTGNVTIANATGSPVIYDDLVVLPFKVLDDWPEQWFTEGDGGQAFGSLPYLPASGDLIYEQNYRSVLGTVEDGNLMKTADGMRMTLNVELRAA